MPTNQEQFSFLLLSSFSGYCIYQFYLRTGYSAEHTAYITFLMSMLASFAGLLKEYNVIQESGNFYEIITYSEMMLAIPSMACEVWLKNGIATKEVALCHVVLAIIFLFFYLINKPLDEELVNTGIVLCALSMGTVCVAVTDYCGLAAAMFWAFGYFNFKKSTGHCVDADCVAWYNYSTCVFLYFSFKSLTT